MNYSEEHPLNEWNKEWQRRHSPAGRVLGGLILTAVGIGLIVQRTSHPFPDFVFSWPMGLIALSLFMGARRLFRGGKWLVVLFIGAAFLAEDFYPGFYISNFFWPAVIVFIGLSMMLRPKRRMGWYKHRMKWNKHAMKYGNVADFVSAEESGDRIESVNVMGGCKKKILSKDFKGGEVTCVFGGAEIDLSQADINGIITLELIQVFGGTKLIVPAHWTIRHTETVSFLGGIEDKRPRNMQQDETKILVLKGTSVFGGIQINSY